MISAVINTLNEEDHIFDCISSLQSFADEVLVCDMHSDDNTVTIAKQLGAKVVFHERIEYVEPARHHAISKASYNWILVIDADERLPEKLANRLKQIAKDDVADVVLFRFVTEYFGDFVWIDAFSSKRVARFFRKSVYLSTYREEESLVHNNFASMANLATNKLILPDDYFIFHLAYPTIEKFVSKTIGKYARLNAENYHQREIQFSLPLLLFAPIKTFLSRYIWRGGFRAGIRGFIISVLLACYQFATWANLWLIEELKRDGTVDRFLVTSGRQGKSVK